MTQVSQLTFDPRGLLDSGVIFADDCHCQRGAVEPKGQLRHAACGAERKAVLYRHVGRILLRKGDVFDELLHRAGILADV